MTTFPRRNPPRHTQIAIGIRIAENLWRIILPFRKNDDVALNQRVTEAAGRLFKERRWEPVWQSEFRLHRRVSSSFAEGRVVLAGDAAHLNSRAGGQGMNAGIQDTELLTRAIIDTLDQGRPDPLAEYGRERRHKIQKGVNRFTDILTRLLLIGRGRMFRVSLALANQAMRVAPIRRRILKRLAMLD